MRGLEVQLMVGSIVMIYSFSPSSLLPPAESISESETCVIEKRDTLDGETVKRETRATGLVLQVGRLCFVVVSGGDPLVDVGRGNKEKSSSHSNPALSSEIFPSEESSETLTLSCWFGTLLLVLCLLDSPSRGKL